MSTTVIGGTTLFAPSTPPAAKGTGPTALGKDDFLKLMVTQLRYQDPLNPLDQNQFLAQTAQFTSLESLQNIGKTLEEMKQGASASRLTQQAGLLGRTVTAVGRGVHVDGRGTSVPLTFAIDAPGAVVIDVMDQQGTVLRQLIGTIDTAGMKSFPWDGRDDAGRPLSQGDYFYRVAAEGGATAFASQGVVSALRFENGQARFTVDGFAVREEDIIGLA